MRSEKDRMLAGEPYRADAPELVADRQRAAAWMARYNGAVAGPEDRLALLRELMAAVGHGAEVRPPFFCDYGYNIHLGEGAYLNFGCVILDVVEVRIGALAQVGPGVQILPADHPRDAGERAAGLESGRPVRVGQGAWIGGGAILLPGVTVGDGAIVGAGAVVTRDVPPGVTAVGNPARPLDGR
ncbi:MAG TPA: sugar O-acetyltransferase [Paracoccaceae bacterium]|nr:sugar O-acetyltransferase [Paracoccaceae bacterium]